MGKVESLEQAAELRESIGRIMHESWSVTKRAQGFHGPNEKCVSSRVINGIPTSWSGCVKDTKYVYGEWYRCIYFHPDLIPWEELPEAQKDINRHAFDTVLEKYDLIPKGTLAERERQVWAEAAKVASEYGKWISVKEKLPGLGDLVLLHSTAIGMNMFLGRRHSERCDGGIWVNGKFCTHWLALPNPPKV